MQPAFFSPAGVPICHLAQQTSTPDTSIRAVTWQSFLDLSTHRISSNTAGSRFAAPLSSCASVFCYALSCATHNERAVTVVWLWTSSIIAWLLLQFSRSQPQHRQALLAVLLDPLLRKAQAAVLLLATDSLWFASPLLPLSQLSAPRPRSRDPFRGLNKRGLPVTDKILHARYRGTSFTASSLSFLLASSTGSTPLVLHEDLQPAQDSNLQRLAFRSSKAGGLIRFTCGSWHRVCTLLPFTFSQMPTREVFPSPSYILFTF